MEDKYAKEREALREKGAVWGVSIGDGWMPIGIELDQALTEIYPDYKLAQIKEKFGTMRYYIHGVPKELGVFEELHRLIREAEIKSSTICESCGAPGVLRGGGWLKTLCDEHAEGREPLPEDNGIAGLNRLKKNTTSKD